MLLIISKITTTLTYNLPQSYSKLIFLHFGALKEGQKSIYYHRDSHYFKAQKCVDFYVEESNYSGIVDL